MKRLCLFQAECVLHKCKIGYALKIISINYGRFQFWTELEQKDTAALLATSHPKKCGEPRMQKRHPRCLFNCLTTEAGLFGAQYCKTFFEAVNTTTYVQNFLLTSVERVAS